MSKAKLLFAVLLAVTIPSCGDAPVTAPADSTLVLEANPRFVPANGGVSVVTALVIEPSGTFVPNGTEVLFLTDLGQIEERRETRDGVARVNFVADSRSGTANIKAFSGSATNANEVKIDIGSALPAKLDLIANPGAIRSNSFSLLTANVFDGVGNPVANVPVIFEITASIPGNPPTQVGFPEYLESGGSPQFTDTNGQALDILRSRRPLNESGRVTVSATTAVDDTDSITVNIN